MWRTCGSAQETHLTVTKCQLFHLQMDDHAYGESSSINQGREVWVSSKLDFNAFHQSCIFECCQVHSNPLSPPSGHAHAPKPHVWFLPALCALLPAPGQSNYLLLRDQVCIPNGPFACAQPQYRVPAAPMSSTCYPRGVVASPGACALARQLLMLRCFVATHPIPFPTLIFTGTATHKEICRCAFSLPSTCHVPGFSTTPPCTPVSAQPLPCKTPT
jgi:hypothetical protein